MDWFEDIPKFFGLFLLFIGLISFMVFLVSFQKAETTEEQTDALTGFVVDNAVPTEVSWLEKASNIQNPFLLLVVIFIILWLFGYIKKQ